MRRRLIAPQNGQSDAPTDSASTSNTSFVQLLRVGFFLSLRFRLESTGLARQQHFQLPPDPLDQPDVLPPAPYYPSELSPSQQCWTHLRSSPPPAW